MGHFKTKSSIFEGFFSFLQIFSSNLQIFWKLYLIKGIKKWENMDFLTFTGYLYYKTITSQDVPSKAQIKNFLYGRRIVSFSRYSRFCIFNHQMIYQICDVTVSISRISHIGGGVGVGHGGMPPIIWYFSTLLPSKLMPPMGRSPSLKNKAPSSEKQTPLLKCKAPIHEMIPRKSTMNNNLKSS